MKIRTRRWQVMVILFLTVLAACRTTAVDVSRQRYLDVWNARLVEYRNQISEGDKKIRAAEKVIGVGLDTDPEPWKTIFSRMSDMLADVRETFVIVGRGETLREFIVHMQSNPTPGLTDVWFITQVDSWQKEARAVDEKSRIFREVYDKKITDWSKWYGDLETIVREQGRVAGKAEELQSLHKQAISFYFDMQRAYARDVYRQAQADRAAQALMGMSMYLNQQNYQQQMLNTLNRQRTCTFVGNTMTCN